MAKQVQRDSRDTGGPVLPEHVARHGERQTARTVEQIAWLEAREERRTGHDHRIAAWFTRFYGSLVFILIHAVFIAGWIVLNSGFLPVRAFDPYPFAFLCLIVGVEVLVLSTFVLKSQNQESLAERRQARVDLQMSLIAEQEITKLVEMVNDIRAYLHMPSANDPEALAMQQPTYVTKVADAMETAEQNMAHGALLDGDDEGQASDVA